MLRRFLGLKKYRKCSFCCCCSFHRRVHRILDFDLPMSAVKVVLDKEMFVGDHTDLFLLTTRNLIIAVVSSQIL